MSREHAKVGNENILASILAPRSKPVVGLGVAIVIFALVLGTVCGYRSVSAWARKPVRSTARRSVKPARIVQSGAPFINLDEAQEITVNSSESALMARAASSATVKPLSLVSGDFDGDGVPDLVGGYSDNGSDMISMFRGNVSAAFPHSSEATASRLSGKNDEGPFFSSGNTFAPPVRPDFMAAGDFDGDGKLDVALASRDSNQLFWLSGDGTGGFGRANWIDLPGNVTAMSAADLNRRDGAIDLAVAVSEASGARLMIFEGPNGALLYPPESFGLPAETTSIAVGYLDDDSFADVAVSAGKQLVVIHGRDRMLSIADQRVAPAARVERRSFPFQLKAVATGDFTGDVKTDLAVLSEDGSVDLLSSSTGKKNKGRIGSLADWSSKRLAAGPFPSASKLTASHLSSLPVDSLVLSDASNNNLSIITDGSTKERAASPSAAQWPDVVSASVELDGGATAVVNSRVNSDALSDLVVLREGFVAPVVVPSLPLMTFTVTTTADNVAGSLRAAILAANANSGADTISFAIGSGPQTLTLTADLPAITDPVTIDATTQPGFGGTPIITINGAGTVSGIVFKVSGGSSTIRGFAIGNASQQPIQFILNGGNFAEGNYLGTDIAGTSAVPNTTGLLVYGTPNNTIGGTTAAARNVLSGNSRDGIEISAPGAINNVVEGNYIGVTAAGNAALANGRHGVFLNAIQNKIGGTAVGAGNVISGNTMNGIQIFENAPGTSNLVQGNFIGTDAAGTTAIPNQQEGILVFNSASNTIGGSVVGAGNTIAGNGMSGITITQVDGKNNVVQGNRIGVTGVPNTGKGILVSDSSSNVIGGSAVGAGNIISFNGDDGIAIIGQSLTNSIRANSIFSNTQLGIDLGDNGVSANDSGDGDSGPNTFQNFPVLTKATGGANTVIKGSLNSLAGRTYTLDFFASPACDGSGNGEGQTYLGSINVNTDGTGNVNFTATLAVVSSGVATATATDSDGNSSEFCVCVPICTFALAPTSQNFTSAGGSNSFSVTTSNGCPWNAVSNDAFITITSGASGTGNGTVNYSVAANTSITPRTGTITVENQTFTVTQDGAPCTFAINPTSQSFSSAGGTGTVTVTSPTGCTWTAVSNDGFITVTSGSPGNGNGTVGYSVAAKLDIGPRTGTITIAGQTFTVTQSGIDCTYMISPTSQTFPVGGGTGTISVTAPGGCNWTAMANDAFITVTSGASGSGNGTVGYSVDANPNPGQRVGTINVAGQTFTVTQGGLASCVFTVSPTKQAFPDVGGTGVVNVTAPFGCAWTAVSNDGFITITSGAAGSGNGSVLYSVAAKTNAGIRTGTMTIAGQTITIPQAGTSCLTGISPSNLSFTSAGGSGSVSVTAPIGCTWPVTSLDSFITVVSGATGTGSAKVKYNVAVNPSAGPRVGWVIIGSKVHAVTQTGVVCTFSISPTSQGFPSTGGSSSVAVFGPAGCAWTAVSSDGFITVTSGASGTGNGTVNYSVAPNLSASARNGSITIAGLLFSVSQDPAPGPCTFSITPPSQTFTSVGGTGSINVTAPGGCPWTAVSNDGFITVTAGASGSGNGTVSYSVDANDSANTRMGTITVAGQVFTVTQSGNCTFNISPTGVIFGAAGGPGSVSVITQPGCSWGAVTNVGWITITSSSSGTGNGAVSYTVSHNTSGASRTGTITIAGKIHTVKQAM